MYFSVKEVSKYYPYGQKHAAALEEVSLDIEQGEFICLIIRFKPATIHPLYGAAANLTAIQALRRL